MGKTGGYSKKTSVTGTQKKLTKKFAKELGIGDKYRRKSEREFERQLRGIPGVENFLNKSKNPYQDIQELFGRGGKAYQTEDYAKSIQQGQELLRPILEGQRKAALGEFDKSTIGNLQSQYGTHGKGSAFNQALAASRANLEEQLFQRSQELGLGMGHNIAQGNIQQRQFNQQQQYGALQDIVGMQQQAGSINAGLRQNAANQLSSAGVIGGQTALSKDQYVFAPKATGVAAQIGIGAAEGFGKGLGMAATGGASAAPAAAAAAA
jgi:hypothetical protein